MSDPVNRPAHYTQGEVERHRIDVSMLGVDGND